MNTYIWKSIKCKQTTDCKQTAVCNYFFFYRNFVKELLSQFTEENVPKYKFTLEMVCKYKFRHENLWNVNKQLDCKQTVCLGAIFNNYSKNFNCFWWTWKDGNWINSRKTMIWITKDEYLLIPLTRGFSPNWFWDFYFTPSILVGKPVMVNRSQPFCELY